MGQFHGEFAQGPLGLNWTHHERHGRFRFERALFVRLQLTGLSSGDIK